MGYKLLLSDADGTLFDFHVGEKLAIASTFAAFSIPVTPGNIEIYHRMNEAEWKRLERGETTQSRLRVERFENFLRETGYQAEPQELCDCFVGELGKQRILLPGAEALCAAVAAHMPIYLVTNGISAVQRSRFEHCALTPYIADLIISEEVGVSKPDPAMVLEALRRADVLPEEAVLLGDSVTADIPAARRAGVKSILFTNGGDAPEEHGADWAVGTLEEARRIILGGSTASFINPRVAVPHVSKI